MQNSTILSWHFTEAKKSSFTESEQVPEVIEGLKLEFFSVDIIYLAKLYSSKYYLMDFAEVYGMLLMK